MKRVFLLLSVLILLIGGISPAKATGPSEAAYEPAETVFSYDFDFFFHLDPSVFPARSQSRAKGYADLLDILELKGSWTWCDDYDSLDADFTIIPISNPSASLSFHLYGFTSHLLLTSPLLGNQTILFNNEALMEFCHKTYEYLGLPLPWLALLYPYTLNRAFSGIIQAWQEEIGDVSGLRSISANAVKALAEAWSTLLAEDTALLEWFEALTLESDHQETFQAELAAFPSWIVKKLTQGKKITITRSEESEIWSIGKREILKRISWPLQLRVETAFPATDSGYLPAFVWERNEKEETTEVSLLLSYAPDPASADDHPDTENLLNLSCTASWPAVWPMDTVCSADLSLTGVLLPEIQLKALLTGNSSGELALSVGFPSGEDSMTEAFALHGTLVPKADASAPWYDVGELIQNLNIFSVNDVTLKEFVHQVARPFLTGLLSFLVEVPASACQSVMDDLTEYGVLNVILGD